MSLPAFPSGWTIHHVGDFLSPSQDVKCWELVSKNNKIRKLQHIHVAMRTLCFINSHGHRTYWQQVKAKLPLSLIKHYVIKTCGGEVQIHAFLAPTPHWSASCSSRFNHGKRLPCPLEAEWTVGEMEHKTHYLLTHTYIRLCLHNASVPAKRANTHITLTFRHRASCILVQAFHYSPENAFYIFNQQIYFII